ncbi:hypothetical protein IT774_07715 [Salinimonas marina]|uniref:Bacteriophage N4 RNA polymerase helical domain-containing protein n=1 Tax=Salinimonas marina TaxID=2785918 RepID=A0A7S9HEK5_9ALTE|nr:hypothetical protein [Salinimonas marina]QPG06982.1 hypothetical protein IT774_07715 [Salinimonas marina]
MAPEVPSETRSEEDHDIDFGQHDTTGTPPWETEQVTNEEAQNTEVATPGTAPTTDTGNTVGTTPAPEGEATPSTETLSGLPTDIDEQIENTRIESQRLENTADSLRTDLNSPAKLDELGLKEAGLSGKSLSELRGKEKAQFVAGKKAAKQAILDRLSEIREEQGRLEDDRKALEGRNEDTDTVQELFDNDTFGVMNKFFRPSNNKTLIRSVPGLLARLKRAPSIVLAHVPGVTKLDGNQTKAVRHFTQFAENFGTSLQSVLPDVAATVKADRFDPKWNMVLGLTQDGKFTEAAKSAMAASAYSWLANDARGTLFSDEKLVGKFLGVKSDDVPGQVHAIMAEQGLPRTMMVRSLGRNALRALGIKLDDTKGNYSHIDKLEIEVGQTILAAMARDGMVELHEHPMAPIVEASTTGVQESLEARNAKVILSSYQTVLPTHNPEVDLFSDERLTGVAREIEVVNEDSDHIIEKLFDTATRDREPSFKPITKLPAMMKGTFKKIPAKVKAMIEKNQAAPFSLSVATDEIFSVMGDSEIETIFGIVPEETYRDMPIAKRERVVAKNNSIRNEIENYKKFRKKMRTADTPFYLGMEVWNYGRFGYTNSMINPQTSKVHRGLVGPKAWNTKTTTANTPELRMFMVAVAQGLGIDIDKQTNDLSIAQLTEKLGLDAEFQLKGDRTNPFLDAAYSIRELREGLDPQSTEGKQARAAITKAVKLGGEKGHTLRALTNLSSFVTAAEQALPDAPVEFDSDLWIEMDGVTNGVVIGSIIFGNGDVRDMKQNLAPGGLYFDGRRSLGADKERGTLDYYQRQAATWESALSDMVKKVLLNPNSSQAKRLDAAMRRMFGQTIFNSQSTVSIVRSMAKDPLMQNVYGAGKGGLAAKLTDSLLTQVDDTLDKIINDPKTTDAQKVAAFDKLHADLITLSGTRRPVFMVKGTHNVVSIREARINRKARTKISKLIQKEFAEPMFDAIDAEFAEFKENRSIYNDNMINLNEVFVSILDRKAERRLAQMIEAGELEPGAELPKAELVALIDTLQDIMPSVSYMPSDGVDNNLQAAKFVRRTNTQNHVTKTMVEGGLNIAVHSSNGDVKRKTVRQMSQPFNEEGFSTDMGVGAPIQNIHSTDASMAFEVLNNFSVVNVHDGFPVGFKDYLKMGATVNKKFMEVFDLNPYRDVDRQMGNAKDLLKAMVSDGDITQAEYTALVDTMFDKQATYASGKAKRDYTDYMYLTNLNGSRTEVNQELKATLEYSTQYNAEGAGYETEVGKANREKRKADRESGKTVTKPVVQTATSPKAPENQEDNVERAEEMKQKGILPHFTKGNQLKPKGQIDTNSFGYHFQKALQSRPHIKGAVDAAIAASGAKGATVSLLKQIVQHIPEGLRITITVPTDDPASIAEMEPVQGKHNPNTDIITLKGVEFKYDGVNPETLTHELIHAVSAKLVDLVQSGDVTDPTAVKAVEEMSALLDEVKVKAKQKGVKLNAHGLSNVKEFIAWGMTNKDFIEGLKQIRVKSRNNNSLLDAFTKFAKVLTKFFHKGKLPPNTHALRQLIELSSVIIQENTKLEARAPKYSEVNYQRIERLSPDQVIEELAQRNSGQDPAHTAHLQHIQRNLVNAVAGPNGVELQLAEEAIGDEMDQYLNHLAQGTTPLVSTIQNVFSVSHEEAFVAEQMEATFAANLLEPGFIKNELMATWEAAKAVLTPESFLPDPALANDPVEMSKAQAKYDYLFDVGSLNQGGVEYSSIAGRYIDNRTSNFLARFAVATTTVKSVRDVLASVERPAEVTKEEGLLSKISTGLGTLLGRADEVVNGDTRMTGKVLRDHDTLLERMASTSLKGKRKLTNLEEMEQRTRSAVNATVSNAIRAAVTNNGAIERGMYSQNSFIAGTSSIAYLLGANRVGEFIDLLRRMKRSHKEKRPGFLTEAVNEIRGETANNEKLLELLRYTNRDVEQERRFVKQTMVDLVNESMSQKLKTHEQTALNKSLLKTDVSSLFERGYSMDAIDHMLRDPQALQAKITALETSLGEFTHDEAYIAHSRALAYYMVTGNSTSRLLSKNAHNIARMFGHPNIKVKSRDAVAAEAIIDELTTLNALKYTPQGNKEVALEVMRREAESDRENGVEFLLKQAKALRDESLSDNFDGDVTQMTKGFMPEVTNPNITLDWAQEGSPEARDLEAKGYRKVQYVARDELLDQSPGMMLYAIEDGGMARRITGVASFTSTVAKGTNFMDSAMMAGTPIDYSARKKTLNGMIGSARKDALATMDRNFDPEAVVEQGPKMIPVYHNDGTVKDFRYEMSEALRESVLQKQYHVGESLGILAGSIVDKVNTKARNRDLIDALHEQHSNDPNRQTTEYLTIGPNSTNPDMMEYWDLLPDDSKQYALSKFGGHGIKVQRDLLHLAFGYRKASIFDGWIRNPKVRNALQGVIKTGLENVPGIGNRFAPHVANSLRKGGRGVEEVVKMIKDNFVVKNMFTTVTNIVSNFMFLLSSDVPLRQAFSGTVRGWREANQYNNYRTQELRIERKLKIVPPTSAKYRALQAEANKFKTLMASSPVHDLMQAGLFQTIVEDIDTSVDPYSFKSKMTRKIEDTLQNKRMGPANKLGKFLFVTQDTQLYKWMNQPIQMSDFAARFAQYEFLTQQSDKPLSKKEALKRVSGNFINYDVPTSPGLQWLNDLGLMMFTKYALRVQRPIFDLFMEKPASMLASVLLTGTFGIPTPFEASFLSQNLLDKLTNPVSSGLDAWDEPLPFNALLHTIGIK